MEISKCRIRSIHQLGNFTIRLGAIIPDTTKLWNILGGATHYVSTVTNKG